MTAPALLPDAEGGFRWVLSWQTDVQPTSTGGELRASWQALPRSAFAGSYVLGDADIRSIDQILSAGPAGTHELPLVHEATPVTSAVTGPTLVVSPTYCDWIAIGRRVLVVGPGGRSFTDTITGVAGGTLTLGTGPLSGAYPASTTHVYPLEPILLEEGQQTSRYAVNQGVWQFRGRQPAIRDAGGAGATLTTFEGFVVLDRRPLLDGKTVSMQSLGGVRMLDAGGAFTSRTTWTRSQHRRAGAWNINHAAERQWWKAFLAAVRGKRHAFLRPTWFPDLTLQTQPAGSAPAIRVVEDYSALWWPSLAHRRVQLGYADGTVTYHVVTSASSGAGYDELAVTPALPSSVPGGSVTRVSFLETVRLDADDVTIEYGGSAAVGWRGRVALTTATLQEYEPTQVGEDFDTDEDLGGDPIELYALAGPGVTWRYTSSGADVVYGGHTWTAIAISRGEEPSDGSSDPEALVVRVPASIPVVLQYGYGNPYSSLTLTITRLQTSGDAREVWSGPVPNVAPDGDFAELRCPSLLADRLQADAPREAFQRQCNNRVFDDRCRKARVAPFVIASEVSAISADGYTVTVSTVGGSPDGFFDRGSIKRISDGEARMIKAQLGSVLVLQAPFAALSTTDDLELEAGCDGFVETCDEKFSNVANFTGHSFIPATRLFLNNLHVWRG